MYNALAACGYKVNSLFTLSWGGGGGEKYRANYFVNSDHCYRGYITLSC